MTGAAVPDFAPRHPLPALVLFAVGYGGGAGFATLMLFRELGLHATSGAAISAEQALLLILHLVIGGFLLLYFVFGAHRFRFFDDSFQVLTWRGRRRFAWADVRRAELGTYRGNVELALVMGPRQVVSLPLGSFRRGASLLAFIRSRVPVPIAATEAQLALIADS